MKNEKLSNCISRRSLTRSLTVCSFFILNFSFLIFSACTRKEVVDYEIPVANVSVEPASLDLAINGDKTLVATVSPANAANRNVTWTSLDPEIAIVDKKTGWVRGRAKGETVITATTENGAKTATCTVNVMESLPFEVSVSGFPGLSGVLSVPFDKVFDNVRVEISGIAWEIISTLETPVVDNKVVLTLPATLPAGQLCKVARDHRNDYYGFWPATGVSDREAKVAGLGDIIAYLGNDPVGRIYLTDWDGTGNSAGKYFVRFHYADRPFALSGNDLGGDSYKYVNASFTTGWNVYANIGGGTGPSTCTTDIPAGRPLQWRFERRP
jgi:hypothetical protein